MKKLACNLRRLMVVLGSLILLGATVGCANRPIIDFPLVDAPDVAASSEWIDTEF